MLEAMRLSDLVSPLAATLKGVDAEFDSVAFDSRAIQPGGLFVALAGTRTNGHDHLADARARGATCAMVEYLVEDPLPQLLVHDSLRALGQLAGLARAAYSGPLVAITGSSGKTTVKEMVAAILRPLGPVLATQGNLNNEIGVPMTLLGLSNEHRYAVIEMGAAARGDIAYSMEIAKPTVSVLTNAGNAHVGRFGSLDNIAKAKGEIFSCLSTKGKAVINLDSPWFESWYQLLGKRKSYVFSLKNPTAEVRAESIKLDERGCPGFRLVTPKGEVSVQLNLLGEHNVANALAATGAALALDVELEYIRSGLASVQPMSGRAASRKGFAGSIVIDDSYNASPASVKAAIDLLACFDGRRILVLGDMAELGEWESDSHQEVGEHARQQGIEALYAVGRLSALAADRFGEGAFVFASKKELIEALKAQLGPDVRVLVKGSRSAGMEEVVAGLVATLDDDNDRKVG
ncbi:UDP-N-acetylmuramoyl-tripeptide--D-alanyl-D-alanine ligase [Pseudomonas sp. gcc21]|uniref:UDP-N-acetylmuramoyl-tripeptide--D-alanyl-D- alanine ligase n=1 Tax=Pseudomonas sp. gcc21 TaxID=2726989 RepID=UPI0014517538|nr:UDP-N-acetylmuramoyl-tripeptide--D-alanyl-D-alanine ligase [Pseudomonas sp. gcc21]QJD59131.1 UDP-N-acetylmuramoyl-tripeptide--D-alanyl-D-alanine ligase [Pseudomonas sp. gcc21]